MFEQLRPILPATADVSDGVLRVGGVAVTELASTYGTPVKVAPISSAPIYNARRY